MTPPQKESLSESTLLLPTSVATDSNRCVQTGKRSSPLELSSFVSSMLQGDETVMKEENYDSQQQQQQRQRQSPQAFYRMGLVLTMFGLGILVRLVGLSFSSSSSTTTTASTSTSSSSTSTTTHDASLLFSPSQSYWDDDAHHTWQEFLANSNSNSNSNAKTFSLKSATGSLLGASQSTTAATTTVATSAGHKELVYFNQSAAFAMLDPMKSDFFHYQQGWEAQITQALCAIATTAAMLNSLRDVGPQFELPMDPVYKPFPWATQKHLLEAAQSNPCVLEALGGTLANAAAVFHMGLGLHMVPKLANCVLGPNHYEAIAYPADGTTLAKESIKSIVLDALEDPNKRVIYNYDRGGIGQGPLGHGHWSPLGGTSNDSFLVMDVAKYKHPMVWVAWDDLWSGAATLDYCGTTLALVDGLDWSFGARAGIMKYLQSRCIPGYRGFVVVQPK